MTRRVCHKDCTEAAARLLQQEEQQEQQVAVADEVARVRAFSDVRPTTRDRHRKWLRFDDFGPPGPKIFFACGAL